MLPQASLYGMVTDAKFITTPVLELIMLLDFILSLIKAWEHKCFDGGQ